MSHIIYQINQYSKLLNELLADIAETKLEAFGLIITGTLVDY